MTETFIPNLFYLAGLVCFVCGLRLLRQPDTARKGNLISGVGMALAIVAALFEPIPGAYNNYAWIAGSLVLGAAGGYYFAMKVALPAMPQAISLFNGLGGLAAVVLSLGEILLVYNGESAATPGMLVVLLLAMLVGGIAFSGSLVACAKLGGLIKEGGMTLNRHALVNLFLLTITIFWGAFIYLNGEQGSAVLVIGFILLSMAYGALLAAPVQQADLILLIALLNTLSGISAAATGTVYNNRFLLLGGVLVAMGGALLTWLMCRAANRRLSAVLAGDDATEPVVEHTTPAIEMPEVKEISLANAAALLSFSQSVIFVPGAGFAASAAQEVCKETGNLLEARGVSVKYAVHSVAGRTPGQVKNLLTEAGISPENLLDLDAANEALAHADLAVVIGANDIVNPATENDPSSAIYGMPVLRVWQAKQVIVIKRSLGAGYAGVANSLFFHERNSMLFGDAKAILSKLSAELRNQ